MNLRRIRVNVETQIPNNNPSSGKRLLGFIAVANVLEFRLAFIST